MPSSPASIPRLKDTPAYRAAAAELRSRHAREVAEELRGRGPLRRLGVRLRHAWTLRRELDALAPREAYGSDACSSCATRCDELVQLASPKERAKD